MSSGEKGTVHERVFLLLKDRPVKCIVPPGGSYRPAAGTEPDLYCFFTLIAEDTDRSGREGGRAGHAWQVMERFCLLRHVT